MQQEDVETALQMFEFLLEAIKLEVADINKMGRTIDSAESAKVGQAGYVSAKSPNFSWAALCSDRSISLLWLSTDNSSKPNETRAWRTRTLLLRVSALQSQFFNYKCLRCAV